MTMQIISGVFLKRERGCRQANILHFIVYKNTFSDGCGLFYKKEYNIENPEFSEMSGIMEKDQQKRICWNRKEALNNQSPKHSSQRIFTVSEQLHYITNREEIFDFSNKKMPYLCGFWRFANA